MIALKALRLAGPGAHLVRRPAGVLHVYTGPLTPSGRFVPRTSRPVCRTRSLRLEVVAVEATTLVLGMVDGAAVCGRCSARLAGISRAEQLPTTRAGYLETYASTSKADVAFALSIATTPAEVDAAAHLSLVLFDVAGTVVPFTDRGRDWPPLQRLVHDARERVHGFPESTYISRARAAAQTAAASAAGAARGAQIKADREAAIARVGIRNVPPRSGRRPTNRGA